MGAGLRQPAETRLVQKLGVNRAADDLTTPPLPNLSVLLKTLAARATSRRGCSTAGARVRGGALSTAVFTASLLACMHAQETGAQYAHTYLTRAYRAPK